MKFIPEGELRSDLLAGLKQGVLVAAGALVLTLPPTGLATLRAPPPSAVAVAPIDRSGPFRPADFGSHAASLDARFVADWVADSGDSKGLPYLILDKRDARLFVFAADGRLIDTSPVLLGAAPGDDSVEGIGTRPMDQVRPEEKTTPAGRFVAEAGRNAAGEEVVWVDHAAAVSMHRVRLVDPKERRLERLASPDPAATAHLVRLHQRSGRVLRIGRLAHASHDPGGDLRAAGNPQRPRGLCRRLRPDHEGRRARSRTVRRL